MSHNLRKSAKSATKGDQPPTPGEPGTDPPKFTCVICGAAMYGAHCKLICPNCGYREDCSDLFPEPPAC